MKTAVSLLVLLCNVAWANPPKKIPLAPQPAVEAKPLPPCGEQGCKQVYVWAKLSFETAWSNARASAMMLQVAKTPEDLKQPFNTVNDEVSKLKSEMVENYQKVAVNKSENNPQFVALKQFMTTWLGLMNGIPDSITKGSRAQNEQFNAGARQLEDAWAKVEAESLL
jgi:hypothetical protein